MPDGPSIATVLQTGDLGRQGTDACSAGRAVSIGAMVASFERRRYRPESGEGGGFPERVGLDLARLHDGWVEEESLLDEQNENRDDRRCCDGHDVCVVDDGDDDDRHLHYHEWDLGVDDGNTGVDADQKGEGGLKGANVVRGKHFVLG